MNEQEMMGFEKYLLKQAQKAIESDNPEMVAAITELYKVIVR